MRFKILNEDKTVNVGGKPFPDSGWCVIICGGSGMGKSFTYNNIVNIDAKHLDVDDVKNIWLKMSQFDGNILTTFDGTQYDLDKENISEPYDLSNKEFTSFVHRVTKPLARSRQNTFLKSAGSSDVNRLPNVTFDITGDNINKFVEIISIVKPMGYKIAIVYVTGEVSQAIDQNETRNRKVDRNVLINKHINVFYTINQLFTSSIVDNVDEVYVVVQFRVDLTTKEGKLKYIKKDNVFRVKSARGKVILPKQIVYMMSNELEKLISGYYAKENY